jgi:hypothetical protein
MDAREDDSDNEHSGRTRGISSRRQTRHARTTEKRGLVLVEQVGNQVPPKLFFNADPGAILANDDEFALICSFPALTEVRVAGRHYVQEDSPDKIAWKLPLPEFIREPLLQTLQ